MDIKELREKEELIDLFCSLAEIPSPSLREEKVVEFIEDYCQKNGLQFETDKYGNVHIKVLPTDKTKPWIMLSSHMDVIGDDSPVKTYLDEEGLIHAQGRTLGADDKAGVANALFFAKNLAKSDIKHGGLELAFTRDEESGMSGIRNMEFDKFNSKYVIVCDSDSLGQLMTSGASYTLANIKVTSFKGGHSGIDIGDKTRENAAKLIAELISSFPQGVWYEENGQVITSCNIGGIKSGDVKVTNVINKEAEASYSIRSSSRKHEEDLKNRMIKEIDVFNERHKGLAKAEITFEEHLPPFEKADDNYIPLLFETVAQKVGVKPEITSFHAGAETHIYANSKNSKGETFAPYLAGLADVHNMHCSEENVDYKSMLKGQELLKAFFEAYNS